MAVTTPMTISTTAAIHRKPPQEVKSTCVGGEKGVPRVKMKLRFRGPKTRPPSVDATVTVHLLLITNAMNI